MLGTLFIRFQFFHINYMGNLWKCDVDDRDGDDSPNMYQTITLPYFNIWCGFFSLRPLGQQQRGSCETEICRKEGLVERLRGMKKGFMSAQWLSCQFHFFFVLVNQKRESFIIIKNHINWWKFDTIFYTLPFYMLVGHFVFGGITFANLLVQKWVYLIWFSW